METKFSPQYDMFGYGRSKAAGMQKQQGQWKLLARQAFKI